jgi:FkbM family methyltransferase
MAYFDFLQHIDTEIKVIFELGSRDLEDSIMLTQYYPNANIYSFECNPDCLLECKKKNISNLNIFLVEKAVSLTDGKVIFYPFDLEKYNNMGASSMLKIDFSMRDNKDPDYNRDNPQKEVEVEGTRLDTFMSENKVNYIDILCIDLQGYELSAIKSLGENIKNVKYIITECSITSTYKDGTTFKEILEYLEKYGFKYICSNAFGTNIPDYSLKHFSEFDAFFLNTR